MRPQKGKTKSLIIRIVKVVLGVLLIAVAAFAALLIFLSVTEYKPRSVEELAVSGDASKTLQEGDTLRIVTWNTGYGALGEDADFFMDGGSMVYTADKESVEENLSAITRKLESLEADIALLQEVDVDSARSRHINEVEFIRETLKGYESSFANNFKTAFLPYPLPPMGKVDSGIMTLSRYEIESSQREALPVPFSWPVSMVNLKRCLNVSEIPIEGSDHRLLVVNLHLEAYDDGEGKKLQTEQLRNLLEEAAANGDYVIAGGDFNQIFSSVDTSEYPVLDGMWQPGEIDVSLFDSTLSFIMDNDAPTCRSLDQVLAGARSTDPEDFQYYMIDGFIVSDNIVVEDTTTIDLGFVNSDHNPVVMNLVLRSETEEE